MVRRFGSKGPVSYLLCVHRTHELCQMSIIDEEDGTDFQPRILSNQSGAVIKVIDPGVVQKRGDRTTRSEEAALRLVKEYTRVPLPELYTANYFFKDGEEHSIFLISLIKGSPLQVI